MALAAAARQVETHLNGEQVSTKFGQVLFQQAGEQTNRMAAAVVFNAVLFQSQVASHHNSVPTPTQMLDRDQVNQHEVLSLWKHITDDINYWPIFGVARELVGECFDDETSARQLLGLLYEKATDIASRPGMEGLVGQLFGELITDRKFLATYYTQLASASFLAELATGRLSIDWGSPRSMGDLRIGDMACGTGALITAVYRRIAERHRVVGGRDSSIHRVMLEDVLIGCDIMPAAVHLTAARMSGEQPDIDYTRTKTWILPFGKRDAEGGPVIEIGSLDLLRGDTTGALFGDGTYALTAREDAPKTAADIPNGSLDMVIMNPPFTRPTNHEGQHGDIPIPMFAGFGTDPEAQRAMGKALGSIYARLRRRAGEPLAGDGTGGLATYFADLAHMKLKPGGVLALILPAKIVEGKGWAKTRNLLATRYENIALFTISSDKDITSLSRSFPANTNMAEAIIVAEKVSDQNPLARSDASPQASGSLVVLERRPPTVAHAVEMARIMPKEPISETMRFKLGETTMGWAAPKHIGAVTGGHPSGVSSADLAASAAALESGYLALPHHKSLGFPITRLGNLGRRGTLHRDLNGINPDGAHRGPFDVEKLADRSKYPQANWPMLWWHDHERETRFVVLPDSQGRVRKGMGEVAQERWDGYRTRRGVEIAGAGQLHINLDFQLNSQPLGACFTPIPAIGGRAWPVFAPTPPSGHAPDDWEKALALWMNTTLGLVARWWVSSRQQTPGRANLTITTIEKIPVLDLRQLDPIGVKRLAEQFDQHAEATFLPPNEATRDPIRQAIDQAVFETLNLPDSILSPLSTLRAQWCAEPSVQGTKARLAIQ